MRLLWRVEAHLKASGTAATRFGREAINDPQFVHDLRLGREPRPRTVERVIRHIDRSGNEA